MGDERHAFVPQSGCNICVCGLTANDPYHQRECTRHWADCPVHNPDKVELPPFRTIIACVYSDAETKDGRPMDDKVAGEIVNRVAARLWGHMP